MTSNPCASPLALRLARIAVALLFATTGLAQPAHAADGASLPAMDAPPETATTTPHTGAPRVGLVLAGGGARGLAHIGVIKYLEEQHIKVVAVAGTSMGSIIAGLYASGMNAQQIEEAAKSLDWRNAFTDKTPRKLLNFRQRQEQHDFLAPLKLRVKNGKTRLPMGAVEGQHLNVILQDLVDHVSDVQDFDQLPIPYRAVAADIATGDPVVISHGNLAVAMRASMSIPGFFAPVDLDGKLLVDGGIAKNIPVDVVQGMGVDRLIVVDIGTPLAGREKIDSMVALVGQLTTIMTRKNSEHQLSLMGPQDVLVLPPVDEAGVETMSFDKVQEAIDAGYKAAAALRPRLIALADPQPGPPPAGIVHRTEPPRIDSIRILNDSKAPDELLAHLITQNPGRPLDKAALDRDVQAIYGLDQFSRVQYAINNENGQKVLEVRATANPAGVSYMKFGVSWDQDSKGESEFGLRASWRKRGLNRLGGEWYTLAQLGGNSKFITQWYQPLDIRQRFFIDAGYVLDNRSLKLPDKDAQVAKLQLTQHTVTVTPGVTLGNFAALRAGVFASDANNDLEIGSPTLGSSNSRDGGYVFDAQLDTNDNVYFPRSGTHIRSVYRMGSHDMGADADYDAWSTLVTQSVSFGRNTFTLLGRWSQLHLDDSSLLTLPTQTYSLGGLFTLSGNVRDSINGNYVGLADLIYYRRIDEQSLLPLDFPLYIGGSFEAGNAWYDKSDASWSDLDYSTSLFFGVDSPLGPVYLGVGRTDDNRYAIYLNIGRLFD